MATCVVTTTADDQQQLSLDAQPDDSSLVKDVNNNNNVAQSSCTASTTNSDDLELRTKPSTDDEEDDDDDDLEDVVLSRLEEKVPNSTLAERERFLMLKRDETQTCQLLQNVLDWRHKNKQLLDGLLANYKDNIGNHFTTDNDDENKWNMAQAMAIYEIYLEQQDEFQKQQTQQQQQNKKGLLFQKKLNPKNMIPESVLGTLVMPRIVKTYSTAETGSNHRVIYVMPAKLSLNLGLPGVTQVTYARAVMNYFDLLLDPTTKERMIIIIECRKLKGCPNVNAARLIPLMQEFAKLGDMMPQRLLRLYICPLPKAFVYILKKIQKLLDQDVNDKMQFIPGPDGFDAKLPVELMTQDNDYLNEPFIQRIEQDRLNKLGGERKK